MSSDFLNKEIFSENLRRYVELSGKTKRQIASDLGVKESSFNGWCRGEYYPRIDKIELMADYFGCTKSDLIERKSDTYVMSKAVKEALDVINMSRSKREVLDFVVNCGDKDISILVQMVRTLKGEENE